jgi:hypothetical protein
VPILFRTDPARAPGHSTPDALPPKVLRSVHGCLLVRWPRTFAGRATRGTRSGGVVVLARGCATNSSPAVPDSAPRPARPRRTSVANAPAEHPAGGCQIHRDDVPVQAKPPFRHQLQDQGGGEGLGIAAGLELVIGPQVSPGLPGRPAHRRPSSLPDGPGTGRCTPRLRPPPGSALSSTRVGAPRRRTWSLRSVGPGPAAKVVPRVEVWPHRSERGESSRGGAVRLGCSSC